jgi:hypothetical protein
MLISELVDGALPGVTDSQTLVATSLIHRLALLCMRATYIAFDRDVRGSRRPGSMPWTIAPIRRNLSTSSANTTIQAPVARPVALPPAIRAEMWTTLFNLTLAAAAVRVAAVVDPQPISRKYLARMSG